MEVLYHNIDMTPESIWQTVSVCKFAQNNLLYLQEAGHFISGANYYTVRENYDSFLVMLTLSGQGVLKYDNKTYSLSPGNLAWINCRVPQHYYTAPDVGHWDFLWFHFYGTTAHAYYEAFQSQTHGCSVVFLPVDSLISIQMYKLLDLAADFSNSLTRDLEVSALLTTTICTLIHDISGQQTPQPVPAILERIRQDLHCHYSERFTLDILSNRYNISKYHLQRSFSRYFGRSPTEYLTELRLTRAKELLQTTTLSVSEIAYRVGMENTSYFIYTFRVNEGTTPSRYRKTGTISTCTSQ